MRIGIPNVLDEKQKPALSVTTFALLIAKQVDVVPMPCVCIVSIRIAWLNLAVQRSVQNNCSGTLNDQSQLLSFQDYECRNIAMGKKEFLG